MRLITHHSLLITPMDPLLNETIDITRAAGAAVMGFYRDSFSVTDKSPDNPVTDADLAADNLLKARLGALLPEAGWLSEETVDRPDRLDRTYAWVVDPLDGTKEFVMGIPEFAVSVALVEDGQPLLAVIYNPAANELYCAQRGQGVSFNGRPVGVSGQAELTGARVDASRSERKRGEFAPFEEIVQLRTMGSIAYKLARVAAGQTDATWSRGPKNEWDICAGTLLVLEGGGRCVDLDGNPITFNQPFPKVNGIIADNGRLHDQVRAALA
ncbi:MAG: 3'(2'),5'-bisphosphate nucleotidase CysQ, partial [Chloroflexi bacterium]|nr:3'(2'),5'-bisphosphate nucleotidase CysQ [Chloroflexota bacterium]